MRNHIAAQLRKYPAHLLLADGDRFLEDEADRESAWEHLDEEKWAAKPYPTGVAGQTLAMSLH